MRFLILVGLLGLALPAFAAEDAAPAMEVTKKEAPEATAPAPEPSTAASAAAAPTPIGGEATSEVEPELAATEPPKPPVPAEAVARGTFTTAVDQREPVDSIDSLDSDQDRVFYFTEFVGVDGRRLLHRWEYDGEIVAEVPIAVGGPRWRAYSSKKLDVSRLGEWTVSVVDETGHVVHSDSFVYEAAAPAPEVAEAPTATEAPAAETSAPTSMPAAPAAPPAAPTPGSAPAESATKQP